MRATMLSTVVTALLGLAASTLGACKWTEFDDLANETWVGSTEKPNVKSNDYGVAIQRGASAADSATSGTLTVIGAGPGTYSELSYDQGGASSLGSNKLDLGGDLAINTLDSPPILLASPDPASAEVALVTTGDAGSIVVAAGAHTLKVYQLFVKNTTLGNTVTIPSTPDAATYMQPAPFPLVADPPKPEPLVAAGEVVLGTVYALPTNTPQPACKLTDGATVMAVRALGVVRIAPATTDDVLVWNGTDGKLHRYPGSVFNGCTTQAPAASTDAASTPAFLPGHGSQILTIDDKRVLLQGHQDLSRGSASFLQVYDATTLKPLGNAITTDGLRTAALLSIGATTYVVAGYPTASVDGKSSGQVLVFTLSLTGGFDPTTPVATLHDAQPEDSQSFGRSVAAIPFNGHRVIAVAADNEIFVYFRANLSDGTAMYIETRQVR